MKAPLKRLKGMCLKSIKLCPAVAAIFAAGLLGALPLSSQEAEESRAAQQVDFFATVSSSSDENIVRMTTDLFFTRLSALEGYTVNDRRDTRYTADASGADGTARISFYIELEESSGTWRCTLNAIQAEANRSIRVTREYESYYRILLDARAFLESAMSSLSRSTSARGGSAAASDAHSPAAPAASSAAASAGASQAAGGQAPSGTSAVTLDKIAGAWEGEETVEKVLILRGGRGFVVYKNGASMNVSVTTDGSNVRILQESGPNASYFPELPRADALENAPLAEPIEWNMTLNGDTLSGTKRTLQEDEDSPSGFSMGRQAVSWTRR